MTPVGTFQRGDTWHFSEGIAVSLGSGKQVNLQRFCFVSLMMFVLYMVDSSGVLLDSVTGMI